MHIEPGAQACEQRVVAESDTAGTIGTGDVAVLATSQVIAWCEQASFAALDPHVPAGSTTVAMRVQVDHIRASAVGATVNAVATLERIEGRRYTFAVSATDHRDEEIATGQIVRVIVKTDTFLTGARRPN